MAKEEIKEDNNYYLYKSLNLPIHKGKRYNGYDNSFSINRIDTEELDQITKEEYENYIIKSKKCNCETGTGNDHQTGDEYDYEEVFKELISLNYKKNKYKINFKTFINCYYFYLSFNDIKSRNYDVRSYYKKACFKCETCLDEKKFIIEDFKKAFKELDLNVEEKERKDYKIDQICKNSEKEQLMLQINDYFV